MKSRDLLIAEAVRDAFVEAMIDYFGKDAKSLRLIKVVDLPAIISSVPALEPYCYVVSGCSIPFYGEFAENDAAKEALESGNDGDWQSARKALSAAIAAAEQQAQPEPPKEIELMRSALEKIADLQGSWGPFPENNKAWCAMAVVTAREAILAAAEAKRGV